MAAVRGGRSVDETYERLSSRRAFLQAAAAGGLGVAVGASLGGCAAALPGGEHPKRNQQVVVVGAGLGGLTAAFRLTQRGFTPTVFEASNHVGGRTLTQRNRFATSVELGAMFIDTNHLAIQRLARDLDLALIDQLEQAKAKKLALYTWVVQGREYPERELAEMFKPVAAILDRDIKKLGKADVKHSSFTPFGQELDRLSQAEWLEKSQIPEPMRTLLALEYTVQYGKEPHELSYLNLLYEVTQALNVLPLAFGDSDERYKIHDGSDAVAKRMSERLKTPVRYHHELRAVKELSDGRLLATFSNEGRTIEVQADKLVLALPFTQLRKIDLNVEMPPVKRLGIANLKYGRTGKLIVGTNSRPWVERGHRGYCWNHGGFQLTIDGSEARPAQGAGLISFLGGDIGERTALGDRTESVKRFLSEIDKIYPGTAASYSGIAELVYWPRVPHIGGGYSSYGPGDYTAFRGAESDQVRNIHFAGEHTSWEFQAFMNGAVESGDRVANEILHDAGVSPNHATARAVRM